MQLLIRLFGTHYHLTFGMLQTLLLLNVILRHMFFNLYFSMY